MSEPLATGSAPARTAYRFQFSGEGSEFFRIWIVNIALTVLTLGVYSAWAKVRTNRYLYGNTSVADGYFDYHADPRVILRGRIIAMLLLGFYVVITEFFPVMLPVFFVALAAAMPWIVIRSMAFNARNSSWRNMRFNFIGEPPQAFGAYVGWPVVGLLTLGLGFPYAWYKMAAFGVNNHRLGRTPFQLRASASDFYAILVALTLAGFALIIAFFLLTFLLGMLFSNGDGTAAVYLQVPIMVALYVVYFNLYYGLRFQTIYQDLDLGDHHITTNMTMQGYLGIAVTNTFAMLFTLGLYYPWAKVNMTRYLVNSLLVEAADLDSFIASAEEENSALGEEFGEVFDLGIGV